MIKTETQLCEEIIAYHGIDKVTELGTVLIIRDAVRRAFAAGVEFGVVDFRGEKAVKG